MVSIDPRVFELVGTAATAIAAWASARASAAAETPLDDLTQRLRQPWRWAASHPLRAVRRLVKGE